ncbi:MAG: BACON domain-containing carbohydrate-binding protein, partial [Bacteroidales bacterium]
VDAFVNTPQATISAYSANASWVTVNSNSSSNSFGISSTVAITCAENTSAGSRSAEVLVPVKVGDQMAYGAISVVQAGVGAPDASVTESSVKFVKAGGSYAVNIYGADTKTTIKTVIPVSWLKAVATNDEVTFTAEPNASSASRSTAANLIFTRGGETEII